MNPWLNQKKVHIVGSGLAGSEAAFFLAERGIQVLLHEMRPEKMTAAHKTGKCAELVCSNSLKSKDPVSGPGILKAEMNLSGSMILKCAAKAEVPAGQALGVDREIFSELVTRLLSEHPLITRVFEEVTAPFTDAPTLIATGPLTSEALSQWIANATHEKDLYFYDAIAPIVDAASLDPERSFLANRYDKGGESAYLNCPMSKEEYEAFIDALISGEKVPPKNFEKEILFQGCQPIESIAASGRESLRFGPMKPVGLTDPTTGRRPWAVVQLRPENESRTAYNLVGFQTKLKYGEQERVFRMIPALKNAEFFRLGSIHRNTYVCGPRVLNEDLSLRGEPHVFLAGQITGVEGYLESAACGLIAAISIWQHIEGRPVRMPPPNTGLGALLRHITSSDPAHYQPANIHFGLFEPACFEGLETHNAKFKKDQVRLAISQQAMQNYREWWELLNTNKSLSNSGAFAIP